MSKTGQSGKWFVVVNIYAASKQAGKKWRQAKQMLENNGVDCEYALTGKTGTAESLTRQACAEGYRRFIAVGGDGTVHDVLNGIMRFVEAPASVAGAGDFTLGVIPMGSGNDWIKSLGIKKKIKSAVSVIVAGKTGRQDVVRVRCSAPASGSAAESVSYMVNVGGIGIDAKVCSIVNHAKKQGKRGKLLYVMALLQSIRERVPSRIKVVCDGEQVYDGDYLSIAFGVGRYSGGGMRQTPAAVMDDALVDMTLIPDIPLMRIARELPRLFTGTFLKVKELVVSKSSRIEVVPLETSDLVEVDGEVVGQSPAVVEVVEGQINVLVP